MKLPSGLKNPALGILLLVGIITFFQPRPLFALEGSQPLSPSTLTTTTNHVIINEFMASNDFTLNDEDGDSSDWIEIYNAGDEAVDLDGWAITDDPDNPEKWLFPTRILEPGDYLLVFASKKDRRPEEPDGELHTNFKLSSGGEYLALFSAEDRTQPVDALDPDYPQQYTDISYGRFQGDAWRYFANPTPGEPNDESSAYVGVTEEVNFNKQRGFFTVPFTVTLTTNTPNAVIRYTLNGAPPSETEGQTYEAPISITGTTTLRAMAYAPDFLPTPVQTQTYIFPAQVIRQSSNPEGFPSTWGWYNGEPTPADYEMDPAIVNHPDYRDQITSDIQTLPVLSVVTRRDDMFSDRNGIYAYPLKRGREWERPASMELFTKDDPGFQINAGVRIHGGNSRRPELSAKHSFRLYFRGEYGPDRLQYPLFSDSEVTSFDKLVVRANFTDSWIWGVTNALLLRDQWMRDTEEGMGKLNSHGIFVNLYVDGLYWGIYNLIERIDDDYAMSYMPEYDSFDILKGEGGAVGVEVKEGDLEAWNHMMALATQGLESPEQYAAIQQYLDIPLFIDYMILNIYAGHHYEWPWHNWYAIRPRAENGRFQFLSWDSEAILHDANENIVDISVYNTPTWLYSRLRANPEFRLAFADRVHKHFFNNGVFYVNPNQPDWNADHPENNQPAARFARRAQQIDPAIVGESARWGDWKGNKLFTRNDHWAPEVERLLHSYFPQRSAIVLQQFRDAGLYPAVDAPVFNQHGGQVDAGFALTMAAHEGTIYFTTDGTDPRMPETGEPSASALVYEDPIILTQGVITVKARTLADNVWSAINEATFHVSESDIWPVAINELMYHPADGGDEFIELFNYSDDDIPLFSTDEPQNTWAFIDGVDFQFPEGVIMPGGSFLLVVRMAPDEFRTKYNIPESVPIFGPYDGKLSNGGERIVLARQNSEGAYIVVDDVTYDDSAPWPPEPDGDGPSLERKAPDLDGNEPTNWKASLLDGGTPGRPNIGLPLFLPLLQY